MALTLVARARLLTCALLCAILSGHAFAQETPDEKDAATLDSVTVTGVRASLRTAIHDKRDASGVVDSITAEDIGKFPDLNLSESLQRVTGVTVTRAGDGEGRRISVRGAPPEFTQTTLNGMLVASGNAGREFDFDLFASELFGNLSLYKTPTADMQEGGLAATIDLRTPRPLDAGEDIIAVVSVNAQYASLGDGDVSPRIAGLFGGRFLDGRLGALISVAKSDTTARGDISQGFGFATLRASGFNPATSGPVQVNGQTVSSQTDLAILADNTLIPTLPRVGPEIKERDKLGMTGTLQFKASDDLELEWNTLHARFDETNMRATYDGMPGFGNAGRPRSLTVVDRYALAGVFDNVPQRSETVDEYYNTTLTHTTLDARWRLSDDWRVNGQIGTSKAKQDELRRTYLYQLLDSFEYDMSNRQYPRFGPVNADYTDPDVFVPGQLRFRPAQREDEIRSMRVDVERAFLEGALSSLQAGVHYRNQRKSQTRGEARMSFTTPFSQLAIDLPLNDFLRKAPAGTPRVYPITDVNAARDLLLPDNTPYPTDFPGVFAIKERVMAGYARANWETSIAGRHLTADTGVRLARTGQTSIGYTISSGTAVPTQVRQDYNDVLPNLNARLELTGNLLARLSVNKAMTRPTLTDLSPGATVFPTRLSATQGNPLLEPFRATQIDASLEWYFADEALFSATTFYKDIDAFIARVTEKEVLTGTNLINDAGENVSGMTFDVTRPVNGAGGKLYGLELAWQQPFTFLPAPFDGLGMAANATWSESEGTIRVDGIESVQPLPGQSKLSYNLITYYENAGLSIRAAWSHRDDYIESFIGRMPDGKLLVQRTDARGQLDISVRYAVNDQLSLSLEAVNLNKANSYVYVDNEGLNRQFTAQGPVYLAGLRYRF